jgi:hypothetical protein
MNPSTIDTIQSALSGASGSGLIIIGLLLLLVGTALLGLALYVMGYHTGWREGRRRWLRSRNQLEDALTEELRQGELSRRGV